MKAALSKTIWALRCIEEKLDSAKKWDDLYAVDSDRKYDDVAHLLSYDMRSIIRKELNKNTEVIENLNVKINDLQDMNNEQRSQIDRLLGDNKNQAAVIRQLQQTNTDLVHKIESITGDIKI